MFDVNIRSGIASLSASNLIKLTNLLTQLAIFTFAGYLALSGSITMGSLLIVVTFFGLLTSQISATSNSFLDGQRRVSYVQRIRDFLHSPTENTWTGSKELRITDGKISFRQVRFSYDGTKPVLSGLSLEIPAGERFALVGKSGCGKTTLTYMLIGFYRPCEGEIWIDGQRLCDCSLKSIRRNIGLIAQDVLIFDGTIKENILLGNRKASDEDILAVCRQAGLGGFIERLPEGKGPSLINNSEPPRQAEISSSVLCF